MQTRKGERIERSKKEKGGITATRKAQPSQGLGLGLGHRRGHRGGGLGGRATGAGLGRRFDSEVAQIDFCADAMFGQQPSKKLRERSAAFTKVKEILNTIHVEGTNLEAE